MLFPYHLLPEGHSALLSANISSRSCPDLFLVSPIMLSFFLELKRISVHPVRQFSSRDVDGTVASTIRARYKLSFTLGSSPGGAYVLPISCMFSHQ